MNNQNDPTQQSREHAHDPILISYTVEPVPATKSAPAYLNSLAAWVHQLVLKNSPMIDRVQRSAGTKKCGALVLVVLKAPVLIWNLDSQRGTELVPAFILAWPSSNRPAKHEDGIDCWWIDKVDLAERMFKSCAELGA
jgi:hypothetical protein